MNLLIDAPGGDLYSGVAIIDGCKSSGFSAGSGAWYRSIRSLPTSCYSANAVFSVEDQLVHFYRIPSIRVQRGLTLPSVGMRARYLTPRSWEPSRGLGSLNQDRVW